MSEASKDIGEVAEASASSKATCNNYECCLLSTTADLQNPVLCVDPSSEMLQVAIKRGGLIVCNTTADDFFTTNDWTKYNKVLLNECAHLFPDTLSTLRKAAEYLPKDGLLILINRANVCTFPLWKELKKKFTVHSGDIFQTFLEQAGFKVGVTTETYTIPMTKGEWYTKLRKRMFTALYEFSDEEIEEGLMELDREWFPGKDEGDLIEIKDTLYFFSATK